MSAPRATVLVVEDEPFVRAAAVDMFEDLGFDVLEAQDGRVALDLLEGGAIVVLIFTDCRMPRLTGPDLAATVSRRWPDIRIVLASGDTVLPPGSPWPLLWKPYKVSDVTRLLDGLMPA